MSHIVGRRNKSILRTRAFSSAIFASLVGEFSMYSILSCFISFMSGMVLE